jgi:hypothetical protein
MLNSLLSVFDDSINSSSLKALIRSFTLEKEVVREECSTDTKPQISMNFIFFFSASLS